MTRGPGESEDRLLDWLQRQSPGLGDLIGDDAAFLPAAGELAVTMDSQIEGVHFLPTLPPEVLARRLLAVNLSDLAAVGARPGAAFLALSAPPSFDRRRFFAAFLKACRRFGVQLSGGDLATTDRICLTLTLHGDLEEESRWLRRSHGAPGQELWVGGSLGESAIGRELLAAGARPDPAGSLRGTIDLPRNLGLGHELYPAAIRAIRRHLEPMPQLELGRWLSRRSEPCAAIDLSDGLGKDLRRLCRASRVGAKIFRKSLMMPAGQSALALLLGKDPELLAVGGGEDYVLLFSLPQGTDIPKSWPCRKIGFLVDEPEISWGGEEGWEPLPDLGWDHLESQA